MSRFNTSGNTLRKTRSAILLAATLAGGISLATCAGSKTQEAVTFNVDVECPKGDDAFILYVEEAIPDGEYLIAAIDADAYIDISCGVYGEGFTAPISTTLVTDTSQVASNSTRVKISAQYTKTKSAFGTTTSASPSATIGENRYIVKDDVSNPATAVFLKDVIYISEVSVEK